MPNFLATALIAAYSDYYSGLISAAIRTACSRNSRAGSHQNVTWLDPPQDVGPLPNPGRFNRGVFVLVTMTEDTRWNS